MHGTYFQEQIDPHQHGGSSRNFTSLLDILTTNSYLFYMELSTQIKPSMQPNRLLPCRVNLFGTSAQRKMLMGKISQPVFRLVNQRYVLGENTAVISVKAFSQQYFRDSSPNCLESSCNCYKIECWKLAIAKINYKLTQHIYIIPSSKQQTLELVYNYISLHWQ